MKITKRIITLFVVVVLICCIPSITFAHGGRTDYSGGHRDNRNKSGLGYYHYHCGGHPAHLHDGGICPYAPKDTIAIHNTPKTMTTGDKINLSWNVICYSGISSVSWQSSDNSIISVDDNGLLTAGREGRAKVTANLFNGSKSFSITVKPVYVSGIEISDVPILEVGQTFTIIYEILPSNATYSTLKWKSSNPKVITIDGTGVITAKANGTATITATSQDGKRKSGSVKIDVLTLCKSIEITGVDTLVSGRKTKLNAIIQPAHAKNIKVIWSSSDSNIATVNSLGYLNAKKVTENTYVSITAKSVDGTNIEATHLILVTPKIENK